MDFDKMGDIKVKFDKLQDTKNGVDVTKKMEMNFEKMSREELVKVTSYLYRAIIKAEDIIKHTSHSLDEAEKFVNEEGFNDIYNCWQGELYGWAFSEWEKNLMDLRTNVLVEIEKEKIVH